MFQLQWDRSHFCKMSIEEELQRRKNRREDDSRDHKDKGKKCYIVEEEDSYETNDEVFYLAMKDESNEHEATTLVTCVNENDKWIIDSGCSHHMTRDKSKFITFTQYMAIVLYLVMMHHV